MRKLLLFLLFFFLFPTLVFADTQLLPTPWVLNATNGASEKYVTPAANVLNGMTTLTVIFDLHGRCFSGGDASGLIFDQNGWKLKSVLTYGTNCLDGLQTAIMPLSAFGVNTAANLTGSFHTRFWNTGTWTVDITSAILSGATPTITPTPTTLEPTPTNTITPTPDTTSTPTPSPTSTPSPTMTSTPSPTPTLTIHPSRPDKTVIVIEENRKLQEVLGVGYFTQLANEGALMVRSFATFHPSQPNYIQFFAGTNLGVTSNVCPPPGSPFSADNLGNQLLTAGFTFGGYAQNLPINPLAQCQVPPYAGHHLPWLYFNNIPLALTKNMTNFPTDYSTLPTLSIVIPDNNNNGHDQPVSVASTWLQTNLDGYKKWAMEHNSLLIIHFDEDDSNADNLIYTVFVGPMIKEGIYNEQIDHRNILSTLEMLYGLPQLSASTPIVDIFQ